MAAPQILLLFVLMSLAVTGCERVPFCDAVRDAEHCALGDESTQGDGDGDGDGDGEPGDGDGEPGDGDGEPGDGDGEPGDGDGDPPDPITYADNPPEDYTRVDRKGMPAVATVVISTMNKDAYNGSSPEDDAALMFVPDIAASVTGLHAALDDDLQGLGLVECDPNDCLAQGGPLVIPDTLKVDLELPAGFPNGRALADPVIDVTLAVLLLDLSVMGQITDTFAGVPVNPPANDVAFMAEFPYLAPPN